MELTVREMNILCAFHSGTRSATLDLLREAARVGNEPDDRMVAIKSLSEKLSGMKDGDTVSLAFDSEK